MNGKRRRREFLFPAAFVLIIVLALAGVRLVLTALYPLQYEELIDRYSKENGLSPAFVYGVIHTESRFRADAVSPIGARGLMQITEETFEWTQWRMGDTETAYDDLFDPETNTSSFSAARRVRRRGRGARRLSRGMGKRQALAFGRRTQRRWNCARQYPLYRHRVVCPKGSENRRRLPQALQ